MSTFTVPIVTIKSITPNINSDNLDILTFEEIAWVCQDIRGKHHVRDKVVYIPIDSLVDCTRQEFKFLEKNAKIRNGKPMARIKTIKLRSEISQGLVIDVPCLNQGIVGNQSIQEAIDQQDIILKSEIDLSNYFGITKYEPPQEAVFSANAKGTFPSWCPKTDAERYQNVNRTVEPYLNEAYTVSIKVDGTSMTIFYDGLRIGDEFGVCSRNQELKPPSEDLSANNLTKYGFSMDVYWKSVIAHKLLDKAKAIAFELSVDRVALQFELAGEGIQKNHLGLKGQTPFLFDIYVTKPGFEGYLDYARVLALSDHYDIITVPIVHKEIILSQLLGNPPDFSFINEMKYQNGQLIEGLVFASSYEKLVGKLGRLKFKFINPYYLLKTEKNDE